jgi:hypothetical protein
VIAYKLACAESLAGRKDVALSWLDRAFQRGFNDLEELFYSSELAPVRNEVRFNYLVEKYFPEGRQ